MDNLNRLDEFDQIVVADSAKLAPCYTQLVEDDADSRYDQLNPITLTVEDMVRKLMIFIDLQKVKGSNEVEALTAFRSFIRRMILKDFGAGLNEPEFDTEDQLIKWFHSRWEDRHVYIDIPDEYLKYLSGDHALFTPPRLEPSDIATFNQKPFWERGPKGFISRPNKGASNRAGDSDDNVHYRTFVVRQNLPHHLYVELPEEVANKALSDGLPAVEHSENAYLLGRSVEDARSASASRSQQQDSFGTESVNQKRVCLIIDTDKLTLDQASFYTKKMSGSKNKGGHRTFGIFYEGEIPATSVSIAASQKVKGHY